MLKTAIGGGGLDLQKVRSDFPVLKRQVHGKKLVYLDNAATTQKPKQVIDAISDYYSNYNSNIHRSVHQLAEEATEAFEAARDTLQSFVNAGRRSEVIFTRNATEALNLASRSVAERFLKSDDKIVVTEMDHHSNFVPWQQIAKKISAKLEIVRIDDSYELDLSDLDSKLADARILSFPHMSNVLGTINDAKKLTKMGHDHGAIVVVDGAQSSPHLPVDVQDIDCDFFALSAHKMLGPTGVGSLYGKSNLLEEIPPLLVGGDMIKEVSREETTWNDLPWKFEAGTSNIAGVIGFGAALDYLRHLGMGNIMDHEERICEDALAALNKLEGMRIFGPSDYEHRGAVFSFNLGKIHAHDVASILNDEGIAIRSGHHCAQILMKRLGVIATSRASFYIYNGLDDLESLCLGLKRVSEVIS